MSINEIPFLNPPEVQVARFAVLAAHPFVSTPSQPTHVLAIGG